MSQLIDLDKYFDQVYCINLKSRPDRLTAFKKNYKVLGTDKITITEAVNGKEIDPGSWQYSLGSLGCRLSHLNIYKEALNNHYTRILVLEDDVIIQKNFRKKLTELINLVNDDWDMIYFGGYHYLKPDTISNDFIKLNNTLTTHAIAFNTRCLPKVIHKIESDQRWLDSVIADLHPSLKVYGFVKPLALQKTGYSDIEEKNINYNPGFFDKVVFKLKKMVKS